MLLYARVVIPFNLDTSFTFRYELGAPTGVTQKEDQHGRSCFFLHRPPFCSDYLYVNREEALAIPFTRRRSSVKFCMYSRSIPFPLLEFG